MKKVILAVLDGMGYRKETKGNAIKMANTPNLDYLLNKYPNTLLEASGNYVGLPDGQMGNSEVGHMTIGAGRTILMSLERINKAIKDKELENNEAIKKAINHAKENNSKLHIFGLLSDGGVHSHIDHILALCLIAKKNNIKNLYLHIFLDGRDTPPKEALTYLNKLNDFINKEQIGKIATIQGRYYAMDREGMWDVTKKAYDAIVNGIGKKENDYQKMLKECYEKNITDEFIPPYIYNEKGMVESNDSLIIANFRPDRLAQLFWAITDKDFPHFKVKELNNLLTVTMMNVSENVKCINAFKPYNIENTLGEVLERNGYKSLRIAEDSKYPHVTHFFDGDKDVEYSHTDKIKVPRKKVATYDLYPKMSAYEVTEEIVNKMNNYDFIFVNYANGDMVGHTGKLDKAIEAVEAIDENVGKLYKACQENNFILLLTADHGNAEEMIDKNNNAITSHTTNPVHLIICKEGYNLNEGSLRDIAPTILDIVDIKKPQEMTGKSLIK